MVAVGIVGGSPALIVLVSLISLGFLPFADRCGRCFAVPLGLPARLDGNHLGAVVAFTDEVDMNIDLAERWGPRSLSVAAQGVRLLRATSLLCWHGCPSESGR